MTVENQQPTPQEQQPAQEQQQTAQNTGGTEPSAGASPESGASTEKAVTESEVLEALKSVFDPELMINVVDLGLVYNVQVQGNEVNVDLGLTTPMCPAGPQMLQQAKQAVEALRPGLTVNVRLTLDPPWSPDRMSEEARNRLGIF